MAIVVPTSEILARISVRIMEILGAAQYVLIEKENFGRFSSNLEKIHLLVREMDMAGVEDAHDLQSSMACLENGLKNAKDLVEFCRISSRFYLLVHSQSVLKRLKQTTEELGRAFSHILISQLDLPIEVKHKVMLLSKELQEMEFESPQEVQDFVSKIKMCLQNPEERNGFSGDSLLVEIANVVGADADPLALKKEIEKLSKEKEAMESEKNEPELLGLQRILALLGSADVAYAKREREKQYMNKKASVGSHSFPPLHSFYCPITQEVMEDPVEVASGHAFERKAIQKWFAEGHRICPLSLVELEHLDLKPNTMLKRSIDEWKTRNLQIRLTSMGSKLNSEDEAVVSTTLEELYELCEAKSVLSHWIVIEGLVPILVNLLKSIKSTIRRKVYMILTMLVKGNLDNKVRACEAGAITCAVHSLAREMLEARQALSFILELSTEQKLCKQLSKTQGCVLLLVTMTNSEIRQAAEDAQTVLENLAKSKDHNVILMAEANYFKPLVQRMVEGSDMTQILMANTISGMQLTDNSREALIQLGILEPLVNMLSEGNYELKLASLGTLQNLSRLARNRDEIVNAGIVKLLLEILFTSKSVLMTVKEQAADVLANLTAAPNGLSNESYYDLLGNVPEPDATIYQLLSLLHLSTALVQVQLLRALIGLSSPPCARVSREAIRDAGCIEVLVGLYSVSTNAEVRRYTLKLLCAVTQDGGKETLAQEMGIKLLTSLFELLTLELSSSRDDARSSAMGILEHLPTDNRLITEMMVEGGLVRVVIGILEKAVATDKCTIKRDLLESTMGVFLRFTHPSDVSLQRYLADRGIIPVLIRLLSSASPVVRCRAAASLGQLSETTSSMACHSSSAKKKKKKERVYYWCIGAPMPHQDPSCKVHGSTCSIEKSFCLLEGQALPSLIRSLEDKELAVVEEVLGALATLLHDEFWEAGADAIAQERGVGPIIRLLTTGTPRAQETALWILERFFRKNTFRERYGSSAQMAVISLAQDGTNKARDSAARILAHMNILQEQSSYF